MHGTNHNFFREHLGSTDIEPHQINVGVLAHGPTDARYRCVCDEVGVHEGSVKFEVPEREPDGN
jgi:hypothetical protein